MNQFFDKMNKKVNFSNQDNEGKTNQFIELKIEVTELYSELVSQILSFHGCDGIILSEEYFSGDKIDNKKNFVKVYISNLRDYDAIIANIQSDLRQNRQSLIDNNVKSDELGSWEITTSNVKETDWESNWKQYWHPLRIGERIIISPSWELYADPGPNDITITLDPGSAFGTGTHQTTRLCLLALEEYFNKTLPKKDISVLDVGTGSGILAITAAKFGATRVTGIDIDPLAIKVAKENAAINAVDYICRFEEESIKHLRDDYDLVLVNILAKVILSMIDDIKRVTKKGGTVILSGIIVEKLEEVVEPLENIGFNILDIDTENEWVAITAKRE